MSRELDAAYRALREAEHEVSVAQRGLKVTHTYTELLEAQSRLHRAGHALALAQARVRELLAPSPQKGIARTYCIC